MHHSSNNHALNPQQRLQQISNRKNYNLNKIPKTFHQLLSFMDNSIRKQFRSFSLLAICGGAQKSRFIIQQNYQKSFNLLTIKQKLDLYQKAVDYGMKIFANQNGQQIHRQSLDQQLQKQVVEILPKQGFLQFYITIHQGFRSSRQIKIKIQKFKISSKNHFTLNVQNYILRKSKKKNPQCYILQVINKTFPQHVRFSFANEQQQKNYLPIIQKIIDLAFKKTIVSMMVSQRKVQQKSPQKAQKGILNNSSLFHLITDKAQEDQKYLNYKLSDHQILQIKKNKNLISICNKRQRVYYNFQQLQHKNKNLINHKDRNLTIIKQFHQILNQGQKFLHKIFYQILQSQLIQDLNNKFLQVKNSIGQEQQLQDDDNIYNRVLQNQNDIKQPISSKQITENIQMAYDNKNAKGQKGGKLTLISKNSVISGNQKRQTATFNNQIQSPINKFTVSEVESVKIPKKAFIDKAQELHKNVFQIMLPYFNLREFQPSISQKSFKQIYMSSSSQINKFTIYQHIYKKQRFKCIFYISLYQASIQTIYTLLINQELTKKWNTQIDQSQIKITLTGQNCLICYQKHKRYNTWFKQRDYLFMRHAFIYKNCRYIADRSIEHNSFIPFQSIQRGFIKHSVTRLKQTKKNQVQIIIDLWMDHCGYLGTQKKNQLNLIYLKQYQNFFEFVKNVNKSQSSVYNVKYCDQNWNIDWIDQMDGSYPRATSLKTQEFNQGSQIDFSKQNFCDFDLQSDDFYSVKDQFDKQNQEESHNNIDLNKINTNQSNNKVNLKNFNKKNYKQAKQEYFLNQQKDQQKQQRPQLQQEQHEAIQKSMYQQPSIIIGESKDEIVLNQQGYCVLPEKYLKKHHPMRALIQQNITNNHQQRIKKYNNIVLKDDFVLDKEEGLLLINKQKIASQNNVIGFIMKTMKKNIFSGKSMLSISLPVQIFKEDSNTQRLAESMGLGPLFLEKAANNLMKHKDLNGQFVLL